MGTVSPPRHRPRRHHRQSQRTGWLTESTDFSLVSTHQWTERCGQSPSSQSIVICNVEILVIAQLTKLPLDVHGMKIEFRKAVIVFLLCLGCTIFSSKLAASPILEGSNSMAQQQQSDAAKQFTRPWSERRGIETIDRNDRVVLVKAPLEMLTNVLANRALEVRRDVLGSEIKVSGSFSFAFQLVGHPWSIMVYDEMIEPDRVTVSPPPTEAQLSKALGKPVIDLSISDTTGSIGYILFEDGKVVEYFWGLEGDVTEEISEYGLPIQRYLLSPSPQLYPEAKQTVFFGSRRRQVSAKTMGDIWEFAERFLIENDAFDPAINASYLLGAFPLKRGNRSRVQNPGFVLIPGYDAAGNAQEVMSVPDLIQVDYFRFGN